MSAVADVQTMLPGSGRSLDEKVDRAVKRVRIFEFLARRLDPSGYYLAFSGGKDSVVIKEIVRLAGVRHTSHYNITTIDPPELVRFIREVHPDVKRRRPPRPFFSLMPFRGIPMRKGRWCCREFKECHGLGSVKIFGIRAAESPRRRKMWKILTVWKTGGWALNPILFWSDADVWQFIRERALPYCELYDEGFRRLGCIGCPMAGAHGRRREFARWPGYARQWRRAFGKLWDRRAGTLQKRGPNKGREWMFSAKFQTPEQAFDWWLSDRSLPQDPDDGCAMGLW